LDLEPTIVDLGVRARRAARALAPLTRERKDRGVLALAARLRSESRSILAANAEDVAAARDKGLSAALIDRLVLDGRRLDAVADGLLEIAALADPVGAIIAESVRPNGLRVRRVRVPIGVIAMIYEARPNVTAEASALAIKSGNAIVLRGGSEARASNLALAAAARAALADADLPADAVALAPFEREAIPILLRQTETIDLAIPRGGEALIRLVTEVSRVPVVQHYKGVCHLFLDETCDPAAATRLALDGKMSRPGVCNALECLLIHRGAAARLAPAVLSALADAGCAIRGCDRTRALFPAAVAASDDDWGREFLDRVIAVRIVDSFDDALAHIARYGSGHTESICTTSVEHAERFRREVDAACVVVNASTRFHDGGELGLGAELGIATSRLHWRGPMGLEALTTMKWIVDGEGQTRG
jgi:glutamate-5-semialdehyde dehydrogenase